MKLKDIGEFGIIEMLSRNIGNGASVIKGIGDDCAVLRYTKDRYLLFTADMIIEDVHFKAGEAKAEDIGHKALAVNISDIAACAGMPKWATVSIGAPAGIRYDYILKIYKGIQRLADKFNIDIVGGDTNLSDKIIISISLVGEVEKNKLVLRSGAKDRDVIVITGRLRQCPDDLTFMPRVKQARYITKNFRVNSMIDISDGFLSDLNHILEASKKKSIIYESLIPVSPDNVSSDKVLNAGEQFELIFTVPQSQLKRLPKGLFPVGEILTGAPGIIYVRKNGARQRIEPRGYTHF